jgi:pilus assembly protein CpaF
MDRPNSVVCGLAVRFIGAPTDTWVVPSLRLSPAAVRAQDLLDDPLTTELQMVGPDRWFTRHGGKLVMHPDCRFADEDDMVRWLNALLEACQSAERVDGSTWRIEAAYVSNTVHARVHVICPPVSETYQVTIAKQTTSRLSLMDMVHSETIGEEMAAFLAAAVAGHCNICVAGATGAGKTTMLNALASMCDPSESIIVVQEVPELSLPQACVKYLYSRAVRSGSKVIPLDVMAGSFGRWATETTLGGGTGPEAFNMANYAAWLGKHLAEIYQGGFYSPVGLDALVKEALRMRPDRIIVGEVRGGEVVDMLKAMSSGHEGLSTVHANGPKEVLERLVTLVLEHESHPTARYAANLVAHSIDLVVFLNRPQLGQYRVSAIMEVDQTVPSETIITHQILWGYDQARGGFYREMQPSKRLKERLGTGGLIAAL